MIRFCASLRNVALKVTINLQVLSIYDRMRYTSICHTFIRRLLHVIYHAPDLTRHARITWGTIINLK